MEERAVLPLTDPKALGNIRLHLAGIDERVSYEVDPYVAAKNASAVIVITEWNLFKDLNYEQIYKSMEKPAFIFDGRNILDHQQLFKIGFNVYPIGKPPLTHFP